MAFKKKQFGEKSPLEKGAHIVLMVHMGKGKAKPKMEEGSALEEKEESVDEESKEMKKGFK